MNNMADAQILQILGLILFVTGLGALLYPNHYRRLWQEFVQSRALVYSAGLAALAIGYLLIAFHGQWYLEWPVIITIFGWIVFIQGLVVVMLPEAFRKTARKIMAHERLMKRQSAVAALFGLAFMYLGFFYLPGESIWGFAREVFLFGSCG